MYLISKRGLAIQGPLTISKDNKFHFLIFGKCIKICTALKDAVLGHAMICPTATSIAYKFVSYFTEYHVG